MGNSYSTNELKACISQDLKINVAFPFFPAGRNKGSAACCVVDAEWIDKLTKESTTEKNGHIILKSPGPPSGQSGTTSGTNGSGGNSYNSSNGGGQQKQSPTVNIYVNILSKNPNKGDRFSLYQPVAANKDRESNGLKSRFLNSLVLNPLVLTPESSDQKLEVLTDAFSTFESIFTNLDITHEEKYKIFLKRIQQMMWPRCKRFRIDKGDTDQLDQVVLIEEEVQRQPDLATLNDNVHLNMEGKPDTELANSNLPDVFAIIESDNAYYFLASYRGTTLQDLITYNPGVLSSNLKKSFVVYQILRALASLHSRGVIHGSLKASNILVDENLWTQLGGMECSMDFEDLDVQRLVDEMQSPKLTKAIEEEPLVMRWVRGDISNYSYLMALNHLAGRREGDPNFHPIMPWITDFSGSSIEEGWRDFTKTKFRMNKGEEQLDFTFNGPVPHHITDILSDITYYVYLARRTPIPVLCQFVRSKYEPNEYPSSMQRLYNWTPDECIPEFYTDPSIFKSMHNDMPDLQIPQWASSPEDFISKHAVALESEHVSENLHHWIDLTFGNNLTGAIEAKNVALPLLAGQNSFMKHGIIQLFKEKHPQRGCNWNKAKDSCDISLLRRASEVIEQQQQQQQRQQQRPPSITNEQQPVVYPDRQSSYSTQSLASQRSLKSNRPNSVQQATLSETPSNTAMPCKERAASVHSTCSSIDTSTSLTSRSTVATEQQPISTATSVAAAATATATAGLTSALRNEPIRLPIEIPDEYFMENLIHYEEAIEFAANYQFPNATTKDLSVNPIYPATHSGNHNSKNKHHYNIDPFDTEIPLPSQFSIGTAYDMYCAGQIIQSIYMAGNSKVMDLDAESEQTGTSGYFEVGNGDVSYDIAPTGRISIPPPVTEIIDTLTDDDWQKRPSAKSILCASFPANSVRDPLHSFPFPECILDTYEYLAAFYQAEWTRRLYLADKWIDRICELENEAFMLILPTFTQLFTHNVTRVGSISLFPKLAQRLGPEKGKKYLLKPIIFMFETLRPNIPKVLFDQKTINEFVKRLGTGVFLQQMLPCYLESLAINIESKGSPTEKEELASILRSPPNNATSDPSSASGSTVPEMAGDALAHICTVLGPILTSKHIVRQLVKIVFRENTVRQIHLHTIGQIAKNFGETFTAIQYQYLISLVDQHFQRATTERNARIICSTMSLLESLMPHMSGQLLATELKSGFVSTLYKLLEPIPSEDAKAAVTEQNIRLRLTLSMRTIDHLVQTARYLPQKEWETTITSMLQKYFSGFTTNDTSDDHVPQQTDFLKFKAQRNYQMIYAYHQFSTAVGKEIMHRSIPTSSSIEKLMYDQFASSDYDETIENTDQSAIDIEKLRQFSIEELYAFSGPVITLNGKTKETDTSANTESQRKTTNSGTVTQKSSDKERFHPVYCHGKQNGNHHLKIEKIGIDFYPQIQRKCPNRCNFHSTILNYEALQVILLPCERLQ
ncbi:hypothetical protein BDA99DRAFT_326484 [Phascolomyces articulosus]|uniref:Protein kinase domain-containing protein n=1 Tax=Phascolomyces articulosus TaxID=60185 RepID=A0AAD5PGY7_9FUNG|nr:hypothetical protein BDA99DRAFT_326484 [Phascolomyces articulosus]